MNLRDERGFVPLALLAKPIVIVSLALAVSLGANYVLSKLWLGEIRKSGGLVAQRDQAIAAGQACSAGVEKLRRDSAARAKAAADALERAREGARQAEARALATLGAAPTVPGDLCASAAVLSQRKLKERAAGRVLVTP